MNKYKEYFWKLVIFTVSITILLGVVYSLGIIDDIIRLKIGLNCN